MTEVMVAYLMCESKGNRSIRSAALYQSARDVDVGSGKRECDRRAEPQYLSDHRVQRCARLIERSHRLIDSFVREIPDCHSTSADKEGVELLAEVRLHFTHLANQPQRPLRFRQR